MDKRPLIIMSFIQRSHCKQVEKTGGRVLCTARDESKVVAVCFQGLARRSRRVRRHFVRRSREIVLSLLRASTDALIAHV